MFLRHSYLSISKLTIEIERYQTMNNQEIITTKKNILAYLSKRQLKNAFEALIKLTVNLQDWHVSERINELETNYKYMLHYMFEGVQDNERSKVYRNLVRSLYELTDDSADELLRIESSNIFYDKLRIAALKTPFSIPDYLRQLKDITDSLSIAELIESNIEKSTRKRDLEIKRERLSADMFNSVFISQRASEKEYADYMAVVDAIDIPSRDKCLFISALSMNLFHRFDVHKIKVLMQAALSPDIAVKARSIVGLVIVMQMFDSRWWLYPELQQQLDTLNENTDFRRSVLRVIIQLIRSRETEKISKKVTEEIIPEMMRFNSLAGKKLNIEDLMNESDFSDKNPEWQKELEESGLTKKLQEYSNLQMEGADVFHSTFANLKSFPFFSEISNWFLPFDISYSEFTTLFPEGQNNNLLKTAIIDSNHMCDSDKYSFCFSLMQISSTQREMMMGQLGSESEQIKEMQREAKDLNPTVEEEIISNQYIQNLYRFFKLNPYRNNFFDIFKLKLNFYEKQSIAPLVSDNESMRKIALYCFDKNYFSEALDIFERIDKSFGQNEDIWQKIGYCKQMLSDMQGALEAYLQADLITPNKSWIIKRIAQIYRTLKQPKLSLEYYQKAAVITPDNLSLELNIGHCYLELQEYDKALNSYFKVELLDTKSKKAQRPIAWAAFLTKKFDLARQYYQQILNDKPTVHDYLNAGHVELCVDNLKQAITFYTRAAESENDFELFEMLFDADKPVLIKAGADSKLFPYILDQVQYKLD